MTVPNNPTRRVLLVLTIDKRRVIDVQGSVVKLLVLRKAQ